MSLEGPGKNQPLAAGVAGREARTARRVPLSPQRERIDAVRQLLRLFRMERVVYLCVTMASVVVLLTCAVVLLWKQKAGTAEILGLFGSTGGITYSTGRLLKMWGDAIKILQNETVEDSG